MTLNRELMSVMSEFTDTKDDLLTYNELLAFLKDDQKHSEREAEIEAKTALSLVPALLKLPQDCMSDLAFCTLMSSGFNSIMDPHRTDRAQTDLSFPLCQYWIASAHNPCWLRKERIGAHFCSNLSFPDRRRLGLSSAGTAPMASAKGLSMLRLRGMGWSRRLSYHLLRFSP